MGGRTIRGLHRLARLYGVQPVYQDATHRRVRVKPESLLAVMRALGAPVEGPGDVPAAWRERILSLWRQQCEPAAVAWGGAPATLILRLPEARSERIVTGRLRLETGETWEMSFRPSDLPPAGGAEVEGERYTARRYSLPGGLPPGYHRLSLEIGGEPAETLIIAAPSRAYAPEAGDDARTWGIFIPLYALHSGTSWGSGDFGDLEALAEWTGSLGGSVVGTLPILAAFLDTPFKPSPYSPASRLFWNEFYLEIDRIPELSICPPAQAILNASELRQAIGEMSGATLLDYRRIVALKRRVLEELARCFFAADSPRLEAFRTYAAAHPALPDYAAFRAAGERAGASWHVWPEPQRGGTIRPGDYDEEARRYHLYAQWIAREQMEALVSKAASHGCRLLLDFPLGVDSDSYDVWRERRTFALEASGGAPPDPFSTKGQDWGFPPLHPERIREDGYRYVIGALRHHLSPAGILRIDHVMGLHRLFWVPRGMGAADGAYVGYKPDELYAILCLESHRFRSMITGEDLGTVPPYVRPAMARHGLHRMYVSQDPPIIGRRRVMRPTSANFVAGLNTHDMATFAAFWEGKDIQDRLSAGLVDGVTAQSDRESRLRLKAAHLAILRRARLIGSDPSDTREALRAFLAALAKSPARVVLIGLEDLWLEKEPQNIPSMPPDWPNWRRRARYGLESFSRMPEVLEILTEVDRRRRRTLPQPAADAAGGRGGRRRAGGARRSGASGDRR